MALGLTLEQLNDLASASGGTMSAANADEAFAFCRKLALGHYENFPVGSILIPKHLRKHVFSIYAFSRLADDIADEPTGMTDSDRLRLLDNLEKMLDSREFDNPGRGNPVIVAIRETMRERYIPAQPFKNLLAAFRRDVNFTRPETMADNIDYCCYSANPVGELVLRLFDSYNSKNLALSDAICTGLQLVNFWQDISVDIKNGRNYIPKDIAYKYGIKDEDFTRPGKNAAMEEMLNELYTFTERFFEIGLELIILLKSGRLRAEMYFTVRGGQEMLKKIRNCGTDILLTRPKLSKMDFLRLLPEFIFYRKGN